MVRQALRRISDEYAGIALVFVVLVALKLLFVTRTAYGPAVFRDELLYTQLARSLFELQPYKGTQYPLLYPASISVAFFFGDHFHEAMKVLNSLYSSAIVLPAYLLARLTLERRESLVCAGVIALIPFHLVLPRSVLSENLFFPLLLLAAWMVLRRPRHRRLAWDFATAFALGALYLTRHIALVAIPVLYLVWWLRPDSDEETCSAWSFDRVKLRRFVTMLVVTCGTYSVWVIMQMQQGATFSDTLGFGIASHPNPAQLTLHRLLLWTCVYGAYFVLVAAPVLNLVLMSVLESIRARALGAYERMVVLVVGLSAVFAVAMVRHSWRAYYNYPDPYKIMGRYAIYFVALYIVLAFATYPRMRRWFERPGALTIVTAQILPVALIVVAWSGLIETDLANSLTDRGAIDVFRMALVGRPLLYVPLIVITAVNYALWERPKRVLPVLTVGLAVFFVVGCGAYHDRLMLHQVYAVHGREIALVAKQVAPAADTSLVVEIEPEVLAHTLVSTKRVARSATYWRQGTFDYSEETVSRLTADAEREVRLRLVEGGGADEILATYEIGGATYSIVRSP